MSDSRPQSASLFNTRGGFARGLPVELIAAWLAGEQTPEAARQLLNPYRVTGTVVVSDSAGLTRLACEREPLEVMALINRPKELVYDFGVAIGGRAMGVWVADNTEMFYPEAVDCAKVASMLLALQDRIRSECEVQIGMAARFDTFFLIGDTLYGAAAEGIEQLAEDRTAGGEVVLTKATWDRICSGARGTASYEAVPRSTLHCRFTDGLRLVDGTRLPSPGTAAGRYPIPFSPEFYQCLSHYSRHANLEQLRQTVLERFVQRGCVLLVERAPGNAAAPEEAILGAMMASAIALGIGASLLERTSGVEIKTAGSLSIYFFRNADEAWTFAVALREALRGENIEIRAGLASGEMLLFDLEDGGREISGSPVNLASKAAQDCGEFGRIYVVDSLPDRREPALEVVPFSFDVSNVLIPGWMA